jgi:hypothetical protein
LEQKKGADAALMEGAQRFFSHICFLLFLEFLKWNKSGKDSLRKLFQKNLLVPLFESFVEDE